MAATIKTQNFGVEIEMNNMSRSRAQKIVADALGSTQTGYSSSYDNHYVIDTKGRQWKCESDSSIKNVGRGTCELVTPVLQYEDIETLQKVIRALRADGAKTDSSCGIHIHVDGANHTPKSLRTMLKFFVGRQDLIYDALDNNSRSSSWCLKMPQSLLTAMNNERDLSKGRLEEIWYSPANTSRCGKYHGGIDHRHYNETRYHGMNLHAFFTKGTVEFRLFNSTLHAGKVKAYIQFCLALSAWAISAQDSRVTFRSMDGYTAEKKVNLMYHVLTNRLGLYGDEFATCRLHMMTIIKKNAGINQRRAA